MITLIETETFGAWLDDLPRDTLPIVLSRVDRLRHGIGDVKHLAKGLFELRIHFGPGYRVYFIKRDASYFILLAGSDKGDQARTIKRAQKLASEYTKDKRE